MISSHVGKREGPHLRLVWLDDEIGGCCLVNVKPRKERSQEVCLGRSNEWRSSRKVKEVKMKRSSLLNVRSAQLRWWKTCQLEQKTTGSERKIASTDSTPGSPALRQEHAHPQRSLKSLIMSLLPGKFLRFVTLLSRAHKKETAESVQLRLASTESALTRVSVKSAGHGSLWARTCAAPWHLPLMLQSNEEEEGSLSIPRMDLNWNKTLLTEELMAAFATVTGKSKNPEVNITRCKVSTWHSLFICWELTVAACFQSKLENFALEGSVSCSGVAALCSFSQSACCQCFNIWLKQKSFPGRRSLFSDVACWGFFVLFMLKANFVVTSRAHCRADLWYPIHPNYRICISV